MNRRINKILLDMLNHKKETVGSYSVLFDVSEQTIRNDLREINSHLGNERVVVDGSEILFAHNDEMLKKLLKALSSFRDYHMTKEERRTILALLLVTSKGYLTTYYLSEYVFVSRNTLVGDMEELKRWFAMNELTLKSVAGKGYQVRGNERELRNAITKLAIFSGLFDSDFDFTSEYEVNIFQNLLLEILDKQGNYLTITKGLVRIESLHQLQLSDYSFQEVVSYLLIMIQRIKLGYQVPATENLNQLNKSSKYEFATALANFIQQELSIEINTSEILNLTSVLRAQSYLRNNGRKIDSIEIQILINEFMSSLSNELGIKYYLNSDLFELLENHIKLMIYRLKLKAPIKNELYDEIYQSYSELFPFIGQRLGKIERFIGEKVTPDELSFVVMYVMALLESHETNGQTVIKTQIVCNSGRGTAQLLKIKVNSLFPQIEVVSVDSSHVLANHSMIDRDLIITTVPLVEKAVPVVLVKPILDEVDIVAIQKAIFQVQPKALLTNQELFEKERQLIQEYFPLIDKYLDPEEQLDFRREVEQLNQQNERLGEVYKKKDNREVERLSDILAVDRIRLDLEFSRWQEAVTSAGELLLEDGLVEDSYIKSMIRISETNDSYIVISPGVAIPHADAHDGAIKVGASFVRLKEPLSFNHQLNDPVKIVIAISIPEGISIGTCLYYFTEILSQQPFLDKMASCSSEVEVISELRRMENKVMGIDYEKNY